MGTAGKVLAIIGAAVGLLSVLLGLAIPALFCWFRFDVSGAVTGGLYLTGFGTVMDEGVIAGYYSFDMVMLVLIGGILVLVGAGLCITGAITEMKLFGIIGGIAMIVGPLLLVAEFMTVTSDFTEYVDLWAETFDKMTFFGSGSPGPGVTFIWGPWIGYFMAYFGATLGLIGGALV